MSKPIWVVRHQSGKPVEIHQTMHGARTRASWWSEVMQAKYGEAVMYFITKYIPAPARKKKVKR